MHCFSAESPAWPSSRSSFSTAELSEVSIKFSSCASQLFDMRCLWNLSTNRNTLCLSLERITRVAVSDISRESWKSCFELKSTKMAQWSLFVTQLNGEYLIDFIVGMIVGEQKIASILWEPRL